MHGKLSAITHRGTGIFADVPNAFQGTRYHSLVVERDSLPDCFEITAEAGDTIMGIQHKKLPVHGVQFHPESIASEHGHRILRNFLTLAETH
jgi:anthranilate synthase/aminodeoxychorismate synthase-like glutamine amidotransferase